MFWLEIIFYFILFIYLFIHSFMYCICLFVCLFIKNLVNIKTFKLTQKFCKKNIIFVLILLMILEF